MKKWYRTTPIVQTVTFETISIQSYILKDIVIKIIGWDYSTNDFISTNILSPVKLNRLHYENQHTGDKLIDRSVDGEQLFKHEFVINCKHSDWQKLIYVFVQWSISVLDKTVMGLTTITVGGNRCLLLRIWTLIFNYWIFYFSP